MKFLTENIAICMDHQFDSRFEKTIARVQRHPIEYAVDVDLHTTDAWPDDYMDCKDNRSRKGTRGNGQNSRPVFEAHPAGASEAVRSQFGEQVGGWAL